MKNHPLALDLLKLTREEDIGPLIVAFVSEARGDIPILTTLPTQLLSTRRTPTGTRKLGAVKYTIRTKIKACFPSKELAM